MKKLCVGLSINNNNTKPMMDLGPSAGFSSQDIQRMTLDNEPSADANAGSTTDGAGPSNLVASAVQNSPLQIGAARPNDETERVSMSMFPSSGAHSSNADHTVNKGIRGQTKTMMLESIIHLNQHSVGDVKAGTSQLNRWETESISNSGGKLGQEFLNKKSNMAQIDALSDDFNRVINSDPFGRGEDTLTPSAPYIEEYRSHKLMSLLSNVPLEKLERTAENDLLPLNIENAGGVVNRGIEALDSFNDVKNNSQDQTIRAKHPPYISMAQIYGIKNKGKTIFDGYVNERISKDESCESAESCSSAGSSVTGKKRSNPDQKLTFHRKRFKKQAEEDSAPSTSFVRHKSSFMNWISNMVNGLSKSNQDTSPCCPLVVPDPNHGSEKQDQKVVMYVQNQDTECKAGFRTMFQSLYQPKSWVQRTEAFRGESSSFHNQCALPNEKFSQIRCRDIDCLPAQHINSSPNVSAFQNICHTDYGNLLNIACSTKKVVDGISLLNSSLGKRKANYAENNNFCPPTKGKPIANHGSLWITQLASKASGSILNVGHRSRSLENSTDCTMFLPIDHDAFKDHKTFEAMDNSRRSTSSDGGTDLQNHVPIPESSFSLERMKEPEDRKFVSRVESVDPSLTSVCFKSSEAIASVFARRVGSLKHVRQSDGTNISARTMKICFFCGSQEHNLQDCSEITDSELGDLLRNISVYDVVDESHGLCLRCFQPNHWAIACPNTSSRCELKCRGSRINSFGPSRVHLIFDEESNPEQLENKERLHVSGAGVVCGPSGPLVGVPGLHSGEASPGKLVSKTDKKKCIALSNGKTSMALCDFVNQKIPNMVAIIFEAIKNLRLSRADIIKWMNSRIPLLPLEGFFLRVWLDKWEEGLGGTGYYVACISGTETRKKMSAQSSNEPISVNVGGMKCLVESQDISNHDFQEDELMAWWRTTAMMGGDLPSEENLRVKFGERRKLGL